MTFVDAGAHVGYYTVLAGRLLGPRGLVLAFEPNPRNYELLLANVWRNGLANVVCFPWALSDETGFTDLYLSAENSGDHRIYAREEGRPSVPVRTAALDALTAIRPPVDVHEDRRPGSRRSRFARRGRPDHCVARPAHRARVCAGGAARFRQR
ncbi:MAG TPA: FkbM family methyltransferase [Gaiellaceae bacterium]|jgi:FkbM family methyltransferase|nr:FkbM family methyltransferase [Gaiellaceae bacterium]